MSPVRGWTNPDDDKAYMQRANQTWDKIAAIRRTATAADAQAVSTMAANYPYMRPGTVVPLAQANVAPDDPLAVHVATEEAKNNKRKHGFFGAIGDFVKGVTHFPAMAANLAVRDVLDPLGGAALGAAKPVVRNALAVAAAPLEVGTGVVRDIAAVGGNIGAGIASGAAVGGAGGALFGGIGAIPGAIGGGIIGGLAGATAEARGVDIESEGVVNPLAQSALFQSFGSSGLGKGYMPGGTAHEEATKAQQRAASIDGHALTPGRFLAYTITEPGTTPYNLISGALDAATSWELDPTQHALKGFGAWRKAEKEFVAARDIARIVPRAERAEAGLVDGARKTILTEKVEAWLTTEKGQKSMQWFADADFESIRQQLGKNKVDIETVRDLANAKTTDEVSAILRPKLGLDRGLELKPRVGTKGLEFKRTLESKSRLFNDLPSGKLDYSNPTEAVDQFNLLLRDANVAAPDAAKFTEEFAGHLLEGTFESRRAADTLVYSAFLGGAGGKIDQSGVAGDLLRKVARRAAANDSNVLRSLVEEEGTKTAVQKLSIDGKTTGLPSAGFLAEHMDNGIDIDRGTLRDIRAVTSKYSRLLANPKFQLGVSAGEWMTNDLWKPTALLRGAWTVRVVGEEQVRMAAAGRLSIFNHPLSYMAWMLDDEGKIAQTFERFGVKVGGRGQVTFEGEQFAKEGTTTISNADELEAALLDGGDDYAAGLGIRQQAEGWHDGTLVQAKHTARYVRGQDGHVEAVAEQIDKLHADPLTRRLAGEPHNEVRRWFLEGEGNELRQALVEKHGAPLRSQADVDRHIEAARRNINSATGAVEGTKPSFAVPGGAGGAGPTSPGGSYGQGIPPGPSPLVRQEVARPVLPERPTPLPRAGYEPTRSTYKPPGPVSRTTGPREALNAERKAAHDAEVARIKTQYEQDVAGARSANEKAIADRRRTQALNEMHRAESAKLGAPPGAPTAGYGNAARPQYVPIEGPQRVVAAKPPNGEILDAIRTGELNGVPIRDARGRINKDFLTELKKQGDALPDEVVGSAAHVPDSRFLDKKNRAMQTLFTNLMSRPSAKLSRSPMFRQHYWSEAENLITEIDKASQLKLIESARSARLDRTAIARLEKRAAVSNGDLALHEADLLAKGRALDATQDLLYDAARRGQMSDVLRIVMPFAEANKEVFKVWAKVGTQSPQVARRAQQILGAARGSGAFYTDPTTGEEMFTFPGSEFLTEHTLGMPIPLSGRVQGLNTFGSGIIPGMGPAVQITARTILGDKPQYEDLVKFVDPFGASSSEAGGVLEQFAPAWLSKTMKAFSDDPESDRVFANAVKDIWASGVSSGKYRAETPEDIQQGLDDARFKARALYFIRGFSALTGVAPTSLSPEFRAMDKNGKWIVADKLKDDLQAMLKKDPDGANQAFLDKYGNNAFAYLQSKSYATTAATPTSTDASAWLKENRGLAGKYEDVAGLFAPQGEEFDYGQYLKNLKSGATISMTTEEYVRAANDKQAKMIFYNQKDRFGPTPSKEQRAWLAEFRQALREEFPGFDEHLPGKPDLEDVKNKFIPQIEKAVNDPKLEDNDIARAARLYLSARAKATEQAEAAGYTSFDKAKAAEPLRDWLRQIGQALVEEVPDFSQMYDRIWSREMVDDAQEAQVA